MDRVEIVAATVAMVNEVTLSESLLEVLRRLRLETASITVGLLAVAGAWALLGAGCCSRVIIVMVSAHDKVVSVELASLSRLHQLVRLLSTRCARCYTRLLSVSAGLS